MSLSKKKLKLSYYRKEGEPTISYEGKIVTERIVNQKNRRNGVTLILHPIFIDRLDSFHVLKPRDLYDQISNCLGHQKAKKALILFVEWLHTKDKPSVPITKENLIKRLWLHPLQAARRKSRIEETLKECFETAQALGYLRNVSLEETRKNSVKFKFELNPDLIRRIKNSKNHSK